MYVPIYHTDIFAIITCQLSQQKSLGVLACFKRTPFYVFSCHQAAIWMVQSVRLSVHPSVRLSVKPFSLCSHHRIIMKFTAVITIDRSDVDARGQGQRSKVKVTEVQTILPQFDFFKSVTPVWNHRFLWNYAQSLKWKRKCDLLFFKVIC